MKFMHIAALACVCPPLAAAAADRLNIRPGTWEITATTQMRGMPLSKDMLAKMTPEQRADIEAAMRAEAAKGPQKDVSHECISEEEIHRPFTTEATEECQQEIVQTTRTTQEVRLQCSGEQPRSGFLRLTAPNPETMRAQLELRAGEGPDAFVVKSEMSGRWLDAACEEEEEEAYLDDEEFADPAEDEAQEQEESP